MENMVGLGTHVIFQILSSWSSLMVLSLAVVFGSVISGLDVVNAMEQVGSDSGKTRVPVQIADSGQLR